MLEIDEVALAASLAAVDADVTLLTSVAVEFAALPTVWVVELPSSPVVVTETGPATVSVEVVPSALTVVIVTVPSPLSVSLTLAAPNWANAAVAASTELATAGAFVTAVAFALKVSSGCVTGNKLDEDKPNVEASVLLVFVADGAGSADASKADVPVSVDVDVVPSAFVVVTVTVPSALSVSLVLAAAGVAVAVAAEAVTSEVAVVVVALLAVVEDVPLVAEPVAASDVVAVVSDDASGIVVSVLPDRAARPEKIGAKMAAVPVTLEVSDVENRLTRLETPLPATAGVSVLASLSASVTAPSADVEVSSVAGASVVVLVKRLTLVPEIEVITISRLMRTPTDWR